MVLNMLKVIVVDDESPVRQWFRFCIERSNKPFVVVGEAKNGKEALALIEEETPDIVLTDIRMPGLDGISLLKEINKMNRNISVAILTSYAEFEYAKEAIIYGADDYILKTEVDEADIIEVLDNIARKRSKSLLAEDVLKNLQMQILNNILSKVSRGEVSSNEINKELEDVKIRPGESNIFAIAVKLKSKMSRIMLEDIIKNNSNIRNTYYTIDDNNDILFIISSIKGSSSRRNAFDSLNDFVNELKNFLKQYKAIGISNLYDSSGKIKEVFYEALVSMYQYFFKNRGIITYYFQLEDVTPESSVIQSFEKQIFNAINSANIERLAELLDNFFKYLKKFSSGLYYDLIEIFDEIFNMLETYLKYNNLDFTLNKVDKVLNEKETLNEFELWVKDEIAMVVEAVKNRNVYNCCSKAVRTALEFMENNYQDNLTLDLVASTVHLNPDYFSKLFKKETGQNFSKYLVDLRINKAKELIENTDLKIYEVAEQVGYSNLSYFSRIYKKHTGINPTEDRK